MDMLSGRPNTYSISSPCMTPIHLPQRLELVRWKTGNKLWASSGPMAGSFELYGYAKGVEFLEYLSDYQLLKMDSAEGRLLYSGILRRVVW
jgi:hypothetical protein